ncbi:MAG: DUF4421 domain-containing protein [Prevotellaceae bacterium]|nr:DUF4421 domain-containing protein [Prevotellaceae bacterium]
MINRAYISSLLFLVFALQVNANIFDSEFVKKLAAMMTEVDSAYVEKSHYDWSVMLKNKISREYISIDNADAVSIDMQSHTSNKGGINVGWRFISGGISYDFNYQITDPDRKKEELGVSIFSQKFNADLVYRRTGGDYSITKMKMHPDYPLGYNPTFEPGTPGYDDPNYSLSDAFKDLSNSEDISGSLIKTTTVGANLYYVFNNKRFSYPAAWSKSARQKISAGSPLAGVGYTHQKIESSMYLFSMATALMLMMSEDDLGLAEYFDKYNETMKHSTLCTCMRFDDYTLWGGYAYNWVPARNFLVGASATLGVGVKHLSGNNDSFHETIKQLNEEFGEEPSAFTVPELYGYSGTIVDIDAVGRLSLMWNNDRLFGGARGSINYYRYRNGSLPIKSDKLYWSAELCFGFKFGESKYWKQKKAAMGKM